LVAAFDRHSWFTAEPHPDIPLSGTMTKDANRFATFQPAGVTEPVVFYLQLLAASSPATHPGMETGIHPGIRRDLTVTVPG
jgi:hypothetical protein